jgi:dimethylsulfone monooxygenase
MRSRQWVEGIFGPAAPRHSTRERFVAGWGGGPIVGTPDQVVDELAKGSAVGIGGIILGCLDYDEKLKHFDSAVMPQLKQAGLRL